MIRPLSSLLLLAAGLSACSNDYTFTAPEEEEEVEVRDIGQWLQLDSAPDGRPVMAYYDVDQGAVEFAIGNVFLDGAIEWERESIDGYPDAEGLDPGDRGPWLSMIVAPDGHVWASYYDVSNTGLRVAHRVGGYWGNEAVDAGSGPTPDAGRWTSIAVDANNQPVVAHHDEGSGSLRVARRAEDGSWSSEEVWTGEDYTEGETTRPADVGEYARLLIRDNTEYLAFYNRAHRRLELLEGVGGDFSHSIVYDQSGAGAWPSLWADADTLVIAFHEVESGDLMVGIREGGGSFSFQTVDTGPFVGADTEVFVRDSQLNIIYHDGYNNDLRHAVQAGDGSWSIEVLGAGGAAVGFHNEVVKLADDSWMYGTYDYTNRSLVLETLP